MSSRSTPQAQPRRRPLPRLSGSVFTDLALWMVGLGLLTGVAFPFLVLVLGVGGPSVLGARMFSATLAAGLLVGGVNFLLARSVVSRRLRLLSVRMRQVAATVLRAAATGDWSGCDTAGGRIPADSDDEIGDNAAAFNQLIDAIDHLRAVEAELEVSRIQARTDELTGLGNRRHFYLVADEYLKTACSPDNAVALLLIDLDRFKEVNDTLGHQAGDVLLQQVGQRLSDALPEAYVLARLGGDEYVALLPAGDRGVSAVAAAERFLDALVEPIALDGLLVHIGASVGIAVGRERHDDRATLMRYADVAMYRAKAEGGGVEVYTPDHDEHTRDRVVLAGELGAALDTDQLVVYYQPKADLTSGDVVSVEALVRWQHPSRGLLAPAQFLSLAEQHGLMRRLTLRVLEIALHQAASWRDAGRPLRISVNLAAANLLDVRFPDEVAALLARCAVSTDLLQLEITEDTILVDPARILDVITRLGRLGFGFSLDDYGTGYSSLARLRLLPIQELKIDRSFVSNMAHSSDDAVIVQSTIELARNLDFHVVAEGVEDLDTWHQLAEFGCHTAQGYFLSPPVPADALDTWLDDRAAADPARRAVDELSYT